MLYIAKLILFLLLVNVSQNSVFAKIREPRSPEENKIGDGKSSLVFVFDTTGSMHNDLKQLREGAEMILNTALEESGIIGDFVFVPFHDPAVGPATVTRDKEVFKSALEVVSVYGGGDCPEKSLGGIQLALSVSGPRSFVYVFTDATAGDHRLVGKVLDSVQRKQSQVVFVLTGHCNDLEKPSYKVYQQIAAASSGQVFNLNKTNVHKVLDFVKSSIKGRTVNLGSSVNPAGYNLTQEIPVDSTLGEVTVSVSGVKPQITVVNPSGEQLTGPPKLVTTLDLSEIMVVKVMQPEPGNWTITVGSEEDYSVKVVGLSNLTFNHGFSVEPPRSMAETSYRPLKGTYNHMMISLSQVDAPVKLDYAEIVTLSGKPLFELPLTAVNDSTYVVKAFIPPEEFFYIAINGRDENGYELRRIGATAVQAKLPDVPFLSVLRKVEAHPHSRVVLKCKVESLVPLTAMWTKGAARIQRQVSSLQTTTIEYVIEDMTEEAVGTYKCVARNAAGTSKALTEVTLLVEPPLVSFEPRQVSIDIGGSADLSCTVLSEALLLQFQIISTHNHSREVFDINVEPNMDGVYSYNISVIDASEADAANHTCVAVNRGGSSNATTTIQVNSKPTAQILGSHEMSANLHSIVTLYCLAQNSDAISWVNNGTSVREVDVNGTVTDFLAVNVTDDGEWTCKAKRRGFEASDSVHISVIIKPTVTLRGSKAVTILNGTTLQIVCEVVAKPQPRIVWYRGSEEKFLNYTITAIDKKTFRSTLQLNSSSLNVQGMYFCVGENSAGIHQDSVDVSVRRRMKLLQGFQDTSVKLYDQTSLQCNVDAYPPPQITWYHNNTELISKANVVTSEDDTTVYISTVDFDNLGTYSCFANNSFESIELNGTLSVIGLDAPVLSKDQPLKRTVKQGESTKFTCRVLKGSPEPIFKWEYKSLKSDSFIPLPNITKDGSEIMLSNVTVGQSGTYRCVAENVVGRDEFNIELIVHHLPQFKSAQQQNLDEKPLAVAAGETVTFTCDTVGVPPPVVTWNKDGHLLYGKNTHISETTLILNNVTEYDSGLFTCTVKNPIGSVQKNFSLLVYVSPSISPPTAAAEQDILEGQLVELPCEARGVPSPEVLWHHNGEEVNDAKKYIDEFGIRFVANLTDFGDYTCIVKNQYGNTSLSYSLFIWVPPYIEPTSEMAITVMKGSNVSIQCDVVGFPVPTIQWEFGNESLEQNSTDLSFNDIGNLYITNTSSKHEGVYVCVAENLAGVARKITYLIVNEHPKILEDDYTGPYLATNMDSALTIACRTTGKPKPYVLWSKDDYYLDKDVRYEIEADGTLTIKSPTEDLSGNYTCTATNTFGKINRTVEVMVYSLPTQMQSEETHPVVTVREHTNTNIECPTPASQADTVKWYKDASLVSTGNLQLTNISRNDQSTYACVVSNAVGSAYSAISLSVEWPPRFIEDTNNVDKNYGTFKKVEGEADKVDEKDEKIDGIAKEVNNEAQNNNGTIEKVDNITEANMRNDKNAVVTEKNNNEKFVNANEKNINTPYNVLNTYINFDNDSKKSKTKTTVTGNINQYISEGNSNPKDVLQNDRKAEETTNISIKVNKDVKETTNKKDDGRKSVKNGKNFVEVVKGDDTYLDCSVDAKPIPKIKWLFNSKLIIFENRERLKLLNLNAHNAGTYKCVVSNSHGTIVKEFKLDVLEPPFISEFDVLDVLLMEGVNATLECNVKGSPEPDVHWTYNNSNWLVDNSSVSATNISAQSEGLYRCDARNHAGAAHIVYRVSVVSGAKIEDIVVYKGGEGSSVNNTIEAELGSHIRIACKATGNPTPSIQWLRNGKVLSENQPEIAYADLTIDVVQTSQAGGYSCVVGNEGGSGERKIRLEVLESPKIFQTLFQIPPEQSTSNTVNMEVLTGQAYYLHCHAYGNPVPELYWFRDGLPLMLFDDTMISTEFGEVLEVTRATLEQSGNYTCVARNKVGNTSLVYLVDVLVPPPQPKEASRPVTVRVGKPLTLTCPVEGVPPPLVMWHKQPYTEIGGNTPRVQLGDDNATLLINNTHVSDSGNYSCEMTNKVGTTEVTFDVTVEKPPSIAGDGGEDNVEKHEVALRKSIVLKCEADGHPLPKISWLKDTQELSDSLSNINRVLGNSLLAIWSVTSRDAGQYICLVENTAGTKHRRYNVYVKVPGKWTSWNQWSYCNVTCGLGHQQRSRSCQYVDENNNVIDKSSATDKFILDESACKGPTDERRKCHMPPCEEEAGAPGQWSAWAAWAPCSATCGAGTHARTRRCKARPCRGDNVQIRKCPNLPKCDSNHDDSENDVFETKDALNENNAYSAEAVFEMVPELVNSHYSPDVEKFYLAAGARESTVFYDVNVTTNLDGSERGPCAAGYSHDAASGTCDDIDECVVESNECHSTQVCVNVAGAYRCTCSPGLLSLGAGQRCMDINECSQDISGCEYACVNVVGGYVCACPAHMRLRADKHHCYQVHSMASPYRKPYTYDDDTEEYLSASIEYPARYKHMKT